MSRGASGRVWLFARHTVDQIPPIYDEVHVVSIDRFLPGILLRARIAGVRLFDWLALIVGLPAVYAALGLVGPLVRIPGPARLLTIVVIVRALNRTLDLPLLERQFWTATNATLFVVAIAWLALMGTQEVERYLLKHVRRTGTGDTTSLLRLARRTTDVLVVVAGFLVLLHYFGIDATAALAGLGIGGIAVALSAQKTLENVIGGVSIIFDGAVRVGDVVKVGTTAGTVEYVGLRSTRIRTMDRTLLTIPNGQIASATVETLSERDKFWFHHFVGVTYQTTAEQLRAIADDIRDMLRRHPRADDSSIRVRVVRFAASSIDFELSVYLFAQDWDNFLELQEALLLDIMAIVDRRGSSMAFPTQTLHIAGAAVQELR